jgi:flagellar hook protein FlgE
MNNFNVDPEVTDLVTYITNLDSRATSQYNGPPFSTAWDGSDQTPIAGTSYVYQTSVRIYDSLGDGHDLSIYFDPHDTLDNVWDYIVCCDPADDARVDANGNSVSGHPVAGLLQRGTITFTNTGADGTGGQIFDITADNLTGFTVAVASGSSSANVTLGGSYTGASARAYTATWITSGAGSMSSPPYPIIHWVDNDVPPNSGNVTMVGTGPNTLTNGVTVTFASSAVTSGANFTFTTTPATQTWTSAVPNNDGYFEFIAAFVTSANPVVPTQQVVAVNLGARNPNGANATWTLDNQSTTQYAAPSVTTLQTQNGFPSGYLQAVSIDEDGVMTGTYSNGRIISSYQIGLALFRSPWGLEKIGDNMYRQTRASGEHVFNRAGTGGVGTITPNALEQSNVDLAEEFVNMIIQQRGFQANSKIITTTDTMLAEVINLKR